jgi:hypothetical protein
MDILAVKADCRATPSVRLDIHAFLPIVIANPTPKLSDGGAVRRRD